jgi:crotonobetainyl-CoA:carnitine CoA-transferase CaiB-like acyl-CoA transferase
MFPDERLAMPLHNIRVLDFSTLLPGPLASLILAEAGAEIIKVERPGRGEDMRGYPPLLDGTGGGFAMLNRGKKSVVVDLRAEGGVQSLLALAHDIDVVIEQFRPGVMARLGVGYEAWRAINPRIVYCAITGYGQSGPRAQAAGHDLNYAAETGLLSLTAGADGTPGIPPTLIADIGGGAYPAVINILLALRQRDAAGEGCFLDIAMTDNLFTFVFWGLAMGHGAGQWPKPGAEQLTGGSPRYRVYRTSDSRYLAVGALEDKFWEAFCAIAGVPEELRDDARDPAATIAAVSDAIAARPATRWAEAFASVDACASVMQTLEEAVHDLHFRARGLFDREVALPGHVLPALPVPVASTLRRSARSAAAPAVGQDTEAILRHRSP